MASLTVPRPPTRLDQFLGGVATLFLVVWAIVVLADPPRDVTVALGVYGFAVHTVLWLSAVGRRSVVTDRSDWFGPLLAVAVALSAVGAGAVAVVGWGYAPDWGPLSKGVWGVGVLLALAVLGVETFTSLPERLSDASETGRLTLVTLHAGYLTLAVGAYASFAGPFAFPTPVVSAPAVSHLLTGGVSVVCFAGLAVVAPRAYGGRSLPWPLLAVALPSTVLGPPLVALGLPTGTLARAGALLEAVAFVGITLALAYTAVTAASRPAGTGGVLLGTLFGVATVALGAAFAQFAAVAELVTVHHRLATFGFLGLTLVAGTRFALRRAGRPLGLGITLLLAGGLLAELGAVRLGVPPAVGRGVALFAILVYAGDVARTLANRATSD